MTAALDRLNKVVPNAPAVRLPLQFMVAGVFSLCLAIGILIARPDLLATYHYNQYIIAVTHLVVLGWITSVIMGAMYQLVPVALETKLHSEKLASRQFWMHLIGFAGMVWMFWRWNVQEVGHFGSLFALGVGMFVYNIARTLRSIPRWNVIAFAVAGSLVWLSLGTLAGLYVASTKCWSFSPFDPIAQMHGHAHLPIVGFFFQMLLGISYKLVPMFVLSDIQNERRALWSIGLLNAGLLGSFICILLQSVLKPFFALVIVAALVLYGVELIAIMKARKRKVLDWGLKYFLTAIAFLVPTSLLGLILSWPTLPLSEFTGQLENTYGFLALLGVVTFSILGMLYKIIPFLIWYGTYSREVGRSKVPSLADLYSPVLQAISYWIFIAGFLVVTTAILRADAALVRLGCAVLAGALLVFAVNIGKILMHLFSPKIEPLPMRRAAAGVV